MKAVKFIYQESFQGVLCVEVRLFKAVFYREAVDLSPVPNHGHLIIAGQIVQVLHIEQVFPVHPQVGYSQVAEPLTNMVSGAFQVRLT